MQISKNFRELLETLTDDVVAQDLLNSDKTDAGDFLSMKGGFLTYLPTAKLGQVEKNYASKNRVRGRAAKVARKFVTGTYTDREFEIFHNNIISNAFSVENLSIVKGRDIIDVYLNQYDKRKQSKMMKSCMVTASIKDSQFSLYTENPHIVRLLVLWDTFKGEQVAVARGLLWKTEQGIYLDRVYGSEPAAAFMCRYAANKGWKTYSGQNWNAREGEKLTVLFEDTEFEKYSSRPYLDTFVQRDYNHTGKGFRLKSY